MSMKENICAINSNKIIIPSEKPRVRKSTEVFGSTERKRLANITNMQQPRMSMIDEKSQSIPASTKEYIDKLKKENVMLMKLLADRNKIIELSGIELHKLRVSVQKLQQQNIQLAQSNSQMLAELTVDKDRLKLLQHELGCKNGLLVAKGLVLKERDEIIPSQKVDEEVKMHNEKSDSSQASRDNIKPVNMNRRQLSKSLGPSTVKESKDKADNKRLCVRRQSARLKSQEPEPADGVCEVEPSTLAFGPLHNDGMEEDFAKSSTVATKEENISGSKRILTRRQSARFKSEEPKSAEDLFAGSTEPVSGPNCDDHMQDDVLTSICLSEEINDKALGDRRLSAKRQSARVKSGEPEPDKAMHERNTNDYMQNEVSTSACLSVKKDSIESKHAPNRDSQDFGRPSIGRPSRQAAKKVSSYKEAPVNMKMRR